MPAQDFDGWSRSRRRKPQAGDGDSATTECSTRLNRAPRGLLPFRRSSGVSYRRREPPLPRIGIRGRRRSIGTQPLWCAGDLGIRVGPTTVPSLAALSRLRVAGAHRMRWAVRVRCSDSHCRHRGPSGLLETDPTGGPPFSPGDAAVDYLQLSRESLGDHNGIPRWAPWWRKWILSAGAARSTG